MFENYKYKYYVDNKNNIIAVSTYAGKTVKGVAKCDPRDAFDVEKGKDLAAARCDYKVAQKRERRAAKKCAEAAAALGKAFDYFEKMNKYQMDSINRTIESRKYLESILADM